MSVDVAASVEEYLALRRAMGYRLQHHNRLLGAFVEYLAARHTQVITVEHALAWACLPDGTDPHWLRCAVWPPMSMPGIPTRPS